MVKTWTVLDPYPNYQPFTFESSVEGMIYGNSKYFPLKSAPTEFAKGAIDYLAYSLTELGKINPLISPMKDNKQKNIQYIAKGKKVRASYQWNPEKQLFDSEPYIVIQKNKECHLNQLAKGSNFADFRTTLATEEMFDTSILEGAKPDS
mmetsp:Transcript_38902/g.59116  ORF Transcript_38902/g.59116 Transcript_38902/m.59116 type:complete len:149 (-) Transcript_38902:333-779(-)|eukprot:CAMPEP_0170502538 /NCGR_PEP_ID=MMETSP0208-20121228/41817_1 /TAXON_ID=197538 /ORGANISM="Strombidium inclinatum, Strain S3" /LENGTH=148 /DNA_ID=CAMNT_0010781667 /DNA_START=204 /DNA_END=650 /DNA_ORIENTATION=-